MGTIILVVQIGWSFVFLNLFKMTPEVARCAVAEEPGNRKGGWRQPVFARYHDLPLFGTENHPMHLSRPLVPLLLGIWPLSVPAEPFSGNLIAERDCPAGISTRHQENPGNVRLAPGETYQVVARNKPLPTHYQLRMESAQPKDRWVEVTCGRLAGTQPSQPSASAVQDQPQAVVAPLGDVREAQYVLAASWQPAFCEPRPNTPECLDLTPDRPEARQFSLHGLWPQPKENAFCGVTQQERKAAESGSWKQLPAPHLSTATRTALDQKMPGTASYLDRHEWLKHGTCFGTDADTYFRQSLTLLEQLNGSEVRQLFASNIGKRLGFQEVQSAFDRSFGPGSGRRMQMHCDQDGLITELRISLKGSITNSTTLGDLIATAPSQTGGCRSGWVDAAGPGR
jgi:ribonuclease T2